MTRINTNIISMAVQRSLLAAGQARQLNLEHLSTGLLINRGSNDPAGLIASEFLRSGIVDLRSQVAAAQRNISMANTADAALSEVALLLVDVRGINTLAANSGTLTDEEAEAYQAEIDAKIASIENLGAHTSFSRQSLLSGYYGFEAGSDSLGSESGGFLESLKSGGDNDVASGNFTEAAAVLDQASSQVASYRGDLGAIQRTQWETTLSVVGAGVESLWAAESAIRDADYAVEMAGLVRNSILAGAMTSLAALANASVVRTLFLLDM